MSTFLPKTHSTRLSLYAAATLCKKTQKKSMQGKTWNACLFQAIFRPKPLTVRFIKINFKIFCYYSFNNFMQKNYKNSLCWLFIQLEKLHFEQSWPQNPRTSSSSKISALRLCIIYLNRYVFYYVPRRDVYVSTWRNTHV